ncbi:hypothetical protein D3C84_843190 [compost metagenome]
MQGEGLEQDDVDMAFDGAVAHLDARVGGHQHGFAAVQGAHGVEDLEAGHVRQTVIEQQQVGLEGQHPLQGDGAAGGGLHFATEHFQVGLEIPGEDFLVVDYQYFLRHCGGSPVRRSDGDPIGRWLHPCTFRAKAASARPGR